MIVLPAIPLLVILTALVGLGFIVISRSTSDAFSSWLVGVLRTAATLGLSVIPGGVQLTRWVAAKVGSAVYNATVLTVHWLSGVVQWAEAFGDMALGWPTELYRTTYWLIAHEIPRQVAALSHAATTVVGYAPKEIARIWRAIVSVERWVTRHATAIAVAAAASVLGPWVYLLRWLAAHVHALSHVIPRTIALPHPSDWTNMRKRVGKLERLVAGGLGVAAVVVALSRLGLNWIRCRNVGRVGRQVCGMDSSLLDSLLGDAVAIFSVLSVVEFANELRAVEDEALAIMGKLVREFPA